MNIQDLGAIGEFVSSVVIIVTLLVLIYEVRGSKQATLQANAQERQRKRDVASGTIAETPNLAAIWAKAEDHLGGTFFKEQAKEFGLEAHEYVQLNAYFGRRMSNYMDAFGMDLSEEERELNDRNLLQFVTRSAATRKYHAIRVSRYADISNVSTAMRRFMGHVDQLLEEQR